ncbi:the biosynthesis of sterol glucoside [Rhizoctonia solani]|uniref:sterol 3beta-glucosyltransferase n=1 Tax=Rhizoctonia solani TaxID=456999 RepID=A0A8H7IGU9_9AGAM|nr:the biosynthesis of sterol glucoside [Rhizoctonia solani]
MESSTSPPNSIQNPIRGTTINTSAGQLGLSNSQAHPQAHPQSTMSESHDSSDESDGGKGILKRTVEKIGRNTSLTRSKRHPDTDSRAHRRLFSLSRHKGKDRAADEFAGMLGGHAAGGGSSDADVSIQKSRTPTNKSPKSSPRVPRMAATTSDLRRNKNQASDSRPSLSIMGLGKQDEFGIGSMRMGTQALIQALQAMPWDDDRDEDGPESAAKRDRGRPVESLFLQTLVTRKGKLKQASIWNIQRRHDELTPICDLDFVLASSIHTIHRPVAHSRLATPSFNQSIHYGINPPLEVAEDYFSNPLSADEDDALRDFDDATAPEGLPNPFKDPSQMRLQLPADKLPKTEGKRRMPPTVRTASMATVRMKRRTKLAEKLKEVFGIPEIKEVVAEMPCWLLRSVLLQGYMYLTNTHLCFFAHMPTREDQVLKSGTMSKKAQRTKRWNKHWFVLKNDVLSWYQSSSDPYFPHGNIDLRYAISCDAHREKGIRLRTNQKTITLQADSVPSRDEWVIFKAQNMGESVKIAIPYSVIDGVERSSAMDFSETIEVKVIDKEENYALDSYFFAYFRDLPAALAQIQQVLSDYQDTTPAVEVHLTDTTQINRSPQQLHLDRTTSAPASSHQNDSTSGFRISSLLSLRPFSTTSGNEEIHKGSSLVESQGGESVPIQRDTINSESAAPGTSSVLSEVSVHTYPPSPSNQAPPSTHSNRTSISSNWSVPGYNWLRGKRIFSTPSSNEWGSRSTEGNVSEIISSPRLDQSELSVSSDGHNLGFSILEAAEDGKLADAGLEEKFRSTFALDDKEALLGCIPGSLFRVLPVYGRLYVSTNYFCFRSSQPLTRTRMMIPIRDILSTEKQKPFRFGQHGLVRRDTCRSLLEMQKETLEKQALSPISPTPTQGKRDALILEELEPSMLISDDDPRPAPEVASDAPVMFASTSSTLLTFKPEKPMHFTCLTIGSRGDVQPYIALCVRAASDGIKFGSLPTRISIVDRRTWNRVRFGWRDPAELMRICVENGMFTVSFLREGVQKVRHNGGNDNINPTQLVSVRGWIDDLLETSWLACQGTDVLIESPSAMAGIHIAEALKIPYFRAFTMPWTRTRAYPHAFAVPERISGQVNRWRRHTLRLPSTNLDKLEQHKVPFLYNFSPTVVPPPLDWYEWIRVTGKSIYAPLFSFMDNARRGGKKIVYIGFGSIVVSDPDAMTQCVVEAIKLSGVHAILSKGWSDRLSTKKSNTETPPTYPPQIYPISSVPHDWLFERIDAACHHGGAGTTGASLRAGIPTIIKPFFGDQFFWSDRVEALGIGSSVRKLTVENLTAALRAATTDVKQIERAKLVGQSIRAENGVRTAIEAIYRDLGYATELFRKDTQVDLDADGSEDETIQESKTPAARRSSLDPVMIGSDSSCGSGRGNGEDSSWSVISDHPPPERVRVESIGSDKRPSGESGDDSISEAGTPNADQTQQTQASGSRGLSGLPAIGLALLQETLTAYSPSARDNNILWRLTIRGSDWALGILEARAQMRGEVCIGSASALSFISLLLLIFAHVGQINTDTVPRQISLVTVNMTGYARGLQGATGDPTPGLFTNVSTTPLGTEAGLRNIYSWGFYNSDPICSPQASAFVDSAYLADYTRAGFWLVFLGTLAAGIAFLSGLYKSTMTFMISTVFSMFGAGCLLIGASILTAVLNKAKSINNYTVADGTPLGIIVSTGSSLSLIWAAFVLLS